MSKDFLGKAGPENYVAGIGRGYIYKIIYRASGFTTRSDLGPAQKSSILPLNDALKTSLNEAGDEGDDEDGRYEDPENETALFSTAPYEADDEEADRIYDMVEKKMDERRKVRRELKEKEQVKKYHKEKPKIQQQFADLKRNLSELTEEDWASIPEVGDLVGRNKRKNLDKEKFTPVPDSILAGARSLNSYNTTLDATLQERGGFETPFDDSGMMTNFVEIGQARDKVLGLKLDQIKDSVSVSTTIDPTGYLTSLDSMVLQTDAELGLLMKSLTTTNPKSAQGWIGSARLEELANKIVAARAIIAKGCEECPKNEDIWLEASRLNTPENSKIILANAVKKLPSSVKIWIAASKLETDAGNRKRVIWKGLESIPESIVLWKEAIELEDSSSEAKLLLSEAVKNIPFCVDFWLALARLESYDKAKEVINNARKANPTSHETWIAAARLEEQHGETSKVDAIISRGIITLSKKGVTLSRKEWIDLAILCGKNGSKFTSQAIIHHTLELDVEEEDRKHTWREDADYALTSGSVDTARAIIAYSLNVFETKKSVWIHAVQFEKAHGTKDSMFLILEKSVKHCPNSEVLWLMWAKETWLNGNVSGARNILENAFSSNSESEEIWLAAVKLEIESQEYERAKHLLKNARDKASTEKVWMKSAQLERQLGNFDLALELINKAVEQYPKFSKLWMMMGQILYFNKNDIQAARNAYLNGVKNCPDSIPLWILSAQLELNCGLIIKARSILEQARFANPKTPELWYEAIDLEIKANNDSMSKTILAKGKLYFNDIGLQECPDSGLLWSQAIFLEPKSTRKSKSADALKKCYHDKFVVLAIARLFFMERKLEKAKTWFNKCVDLDLDFGDAWAWFYKFEVAHGDEKSTNDLVERIIKADPKHGKIWQRVSKDLSNLSVKGRDLVELVSKNLD